MCFLNFNSWFIRWSPNISWNWHVSCCSAFRGTIYHLTYDVTGHPGIKLPAINPFISAPNSLGHYFSICTLLFWRPVCRHPPLLPSAVVLLVLHGWRIFASFIWESCRGGTSSRIMLGIWWHRNGESLEFIAPASVAVIILHRRRRRRDTHCRCY